MQDGFLNVLERVIWIIQLEVIIKNHLNRWIAGGKRTLIY